MPKILFDADGNRVKAVMDDQVRGLQKITGASRAATKAERERAAATHAAAKAHHTPTNSRQVSTIGRLMGGEGGHLLRHGAHFSHLTGGFMAVGAAAIALGVTFKALFAASEHAVEAAKEEAKVRQELKHAIKSATKAADAAGIGAYKGDAESINTLAATGGTAAVERAKRLTEYGPDALKGAGALAAKGMFNDDNVDAAIEAARSGRIGVGAAMESIAGGNISSRGSSRMRGAEILSAHLNQAVSTSDLARFQSNFNGSIYGQRGTQLAGQEGEKLSAGLDRFKSSGTLFDQGAKDIEAIRDPSGTAREEVVHKLQEQIDIQRAAAAAQYKIVAALEVIASAFGGGGSETEKVNRMYETARVVQ